MWLTILFCKSRKTSPSPELPGLTSSSSVPYVQHRETAPTQLPVSTSGVSTPNHGSVIKIINKIGDIVGSTLSDFNNTKIHGVYLMEPPAQLPVFTSSVSGPDHGSSTEISNDFGNIVDSTISNIGNLNDHLNSNTYWDGLSLILSILILFSLVYWNIVDSTIDWDGLFFILSILILFPLVYCGFNYRLGLPVGWIIFHLIHSHPISSRLLEHLIWTASVLDSQAPYSPFPQKKLAWRFKVL